MVKIDWNKIEVSNALIMKENEPIRVKFLDNGSVDDYEITDKQTLKVKTISKYTFTVINLADNTERELSTLATRLMNQLKNYQPLKDKSIAINKFRTGMTDFDIDYKVSLLE